MIDPLVPPSGWYIFGTHAVYDKVPPLDFSEEHDDMGFPLWERPSWPDQEGAGTDNGDPSRAPSTNRD